MTPWLTPDRMNWFKEKYLPNEADWTKWDASPLFAPDDLIAKLPPAWVGVAELDILKEEGVQYAEKLRKAGVNVEVAVYKGAPHPVMAMDGESCCKLSISGAFCASIREDMLLIKLYSCGKIF